MSNGYRNDVVKLSKYLIELRHDLFGKALKFAMDHELSEINTAFDEGETFVFELEHLEDSGDQTLQKLVDLTREIDATITSIVNIHNIEDSELEEQN